MHRPRPLFRTSLRAVYRVCDETPRGGARAARGALVIAAAWLLATCGDGTEPDPPIDHNRPPVANGTIPAQVLTVGESVTVGLSGFFSDPDGDDLSYSAESSNSAVAAVAISQNSAVVTGVSPGDATMTVTAFDGDGLSAQQSFAVHVRNRPPTPTGSIDDVELLAGESIEINAAGYFDDPDGDQLTYSAQTSDEDIATVTVSGATITVVGTGDGIAEVTVTATDAGGLSAQQSFAADVVPAGDPTVGFKLDSGTATEGGTVMLQLTIRPSPESAIRVTYGFGSDGDPGTADADQADYVADDGAVWVQAGDRIATLEIGVLDDDDIEPTREVFTVVLDVPAEGAGYTLRGVTTAVATIEEGICDRTSRVRDELVALAGVDQCHQVDGSHLATIDILDLRGPEPPSAAIAATRRESNRRPCGIAEEPALPGRRTASLPVLPGCGAATHPPAAPSLPPARHLAGATDAITELLAGDFAELTALRQLWLFNNELRELPAGVFSGLSQLVQIHLAFNRLRELPAGLLSGLSRLEDVSIQENELTRLPPDLLAGLTRLQGVWMYGNELTELPAGLFSDAVNLEVANLWGNRLRALPPDIFSGLPYLQSVNLFSNRLEELDVAVFSGLTDLAHLNLNDNRLSGLPTGIFADLENLEYLWIGKNRLEILQNGLFDETPNLRVLAADSNRIAEIEDGTFSNLHEMKEVRLEDNRLSQLRSGTFSGLEGLAWLMLAGNRINDLPPGVFADLGRVVFLNLNYNPLTELKRDALWGLDDLEVLWVGSGGLSQIHPGAFNGVPGLIQLAVAETPLSALPDGTFAGLPNLEELYVYSTGVSELGDEVFAGMPRLRNLYLWDSRLTELPPSVFSHLADLEILDISGNQLATLPPGVFSNLSRLKSLAVQRNNLAELPDEMFSGLSELNSLNLEENPGAPFVLDVQLERTDTADLAAPGPAQVVLSLSEGAPFSMRIPLSVDGGTLSTSAEVIQSGSTSSPEFTVTMSSGSQSGTQVVLGPAPRVPDAILGVQLLAADTLVLFTASGDVSGAEPVGMAARMEDQAPEDSGTAPLTLVTGVLGSAGWRLRPRSKGRGARPRTGCSADGGRCTPAGRERSGGARALSRRLAERAP
ncbi:MAG: leucine-rich repeat protein [Gemmatimonadetes bacterium]|nr:leucine-rich repeat protein [Gemmatimonadota bacterium]MYB99942.1 leucine-rich repeat protein [Gemmatimonadota bacterium]